MAAASSTQANACISCSPNEFVHKIIFHHTNFTTHVHVLSHCQSIFFFCCFYQEIKTRLFLSAPSCLIPLTILAHSFFCVVLRQRSLHHWPSRPQTHIQHITAERTVHSSPAQCVGGCVWLWCLHRCAPRFKAHMSVRLVEADVINWWGVCVCVCWLYWYSYTYEDICLGKTHCCGDSCPSGDVYIAPPLERRCFRVQTVFEVRFRISLRLELRLGVGVGIHLWKS